MSKTVYTILAEWIDDYACDYLEHAGGESFETYVRNAIPANKAMGGMMEKLNVPEAERLLVLLESLKKEAFSYD